MFYKMYKLTLSCGKGPKSGQAAHSNEVSLDESCRDCLYANLTPFKAATREVAECQRGQTDTLRLNDS